MVSRCFLRWLSRPQHTETCIYVLPLYTKWDLESCGIGTNHFDLSRQLQVVLGLQASALDWVTLSAEPGLGLGVEGEEPTAQQQQQPQLHLSLHPVCTLLLGWLSDD